jgi:predicted HAD superfamily hydrolase
LLQKVTHKDVISVDLFDTVLLRLVHKPTDIFRLIEEKFQKKGFWEARTSAEIKAREFFSSKSVSEVTLEEIYSYIADEYKNLISEEIETEIDNIVLNPEISALLNWATMMQKKIVFLSDMYLPQETICKILKQFEFNFEFKLILSSHHRTSKADGSSYDLLKEISGSPKRILHIGDSEWSDVLMANKSGIDSFHYKRPGDRLIEELNLGKNVLENISNFQSLEFSRFLAIATIKRIHEGWRTVTTEDFLGTWLLGPISTALLEWLESEVRNQDNSHIYFLGRDFYGLHQVARKHKYFVESTHTLRYLNASRRSWVFPFLPNSLSDETFRDSEYIEIGRFLSFFSLSDQEKEDISVSLNEKKINFVSRINLSNVIETYPSILNSFEEERKALVRYWRDMGLLDVVPPTLADLGWSGSIVNSLNSYRSSLGLRPANAKFFGHFASSLPLENFSGFLVENSTPEDLYVDIRKQIDAFELMFTGQYPQVRRFKQIGSAVVPEFEKLSQEEISRISKQEMIQASGNHFMSIAIDSGFEKWTNEFLQNQVRLVCLALDEKFPDIAYPGVTHTSAFIGEELVEREINRNKQKTLMKSYIHIFLSLMRKRDFKLIVKKITFLMIRLLANRRNDRK